MITVLNWNFLTTQCPKGMNEQNCPMRKYLKEQKALHQSVNETLLQSAGSFEECVAVIREIQTTCSKCHNK
ncbi:MAG: hypothetical protein IJU89_03325 [Alphaproteobacteria bacterium]|nr:hypothetical protein [Alphaproteobacteria bacterium]